MTNVKLTIMESGRVLVQWESMESSHPECAYYEIVLEGRDIYDRYETITAGRVKAEKKKGYSFIMPLEISSNFDNFVVHVKVLKEMNKKTRAEATAVLENYQQSIK